MRRLVQITDCRSTPQSRGQIRLARQTDTLSSVQQHARGDATRETVSLGENARAVSTATRFWNAWSSLELIILSAKAELSFFSLSV